MLKVETFINQLMGSNCYMVWDDASKRSIVFDPASEKSLKEIDFITNDNLTLDYIFLTHEHTDHTWGVNALIDAFPKSPLVCSELCEKYAKKASRAYFLFYYNNLTYRYELKPADFIIKTDGEIIKWGNHNLCFIFTPSHSKGAICIQIENMLFSGDTIMPFPPHFNSRDSNVDDWRKSINSILLQFYPETMLFPGHGNSITLKEWVEKYLNKR